MTPLLAPECGAVRVRVAPSGETAWTITPYREGDKSAVIDLLPVIGERYPGGMSWLDRRLDDVRDGRATCSVVRDRQARPRGVAIETPKGQRRMKLSTLWVDPGFRGLGAGRALVDWIVDQWLRRDIEAAWVTTDLARRDDVLPAVARVGFSPLAVVEDRYAEGRSEIVYGWTAI